MEKKGNRSVQGSSKGLANDLSKKSQGRYGDAMIFVVFFFCGVSSPIMVVFT